MNHLTPLTPATNPADEWRQLVERIANLLDPDFPSIVIAAPLPAIGEPAIAYLEREKPDFVKVDDRGWG